MKAFFCQKHVFALKLKSNEIAGGFSMGGALALHTALHVNRELAGVFTCSSFLNDDSLVFESLRSSQQPLPKLLMYHGDRDR